MAERRFLGFAGRISLSKLKFFAVEGRMPSVAMETDVAELAWLLVADAGLVVVETTWDSAGGSCLAVVGAGGELLLGTKTISAAKKNLADW